MKKIIYTCILNGKDTLRSPKIINDDWQYIYFGDSVPRVVPSPWEFIKVERTEDPIRQMKYYKIMPHKVLPSHDINVWMDGNFEIRRDLNTYPVESDVNLFKHFERLCLYDEAEVCKSMRLDSFPIIDAQMARYKEDGFPAHYNNSIFPECGRMFRKNNEAARELMGFWYNEVQNGSKRDQLSFMYSVWKLNADITIYDSCRINSGFEWLPHNYF